MLFSVSMFPIGSGDDLSEAVADVVAQFDDAGLAYQVNAMDTVVEGAWDEVMPIVHKAFRRLIDANDRVYLSVAVDEHKHGEARLTGAVADIDRELGHHAGGSAPEGTKP